MGKITLQQVKENYNAKVYESKVEYPSGKYLKPDHVIDENKSVKWNREAVAKHNDELRQQKMEYQTANKKSEKKLFLDVIIALVTDFKLTERQATLVEQKVYTEYHSSMDDYFAKLSEFAEFAVELLKLN